MRILVAHNVPRGRTGGMSRIMGFIHDRVIAAGHAVDCLCADDVPPRWRNGLGRRVAFPLMARRRVLAAAASGQPYDIVNLHEPIAAATAVWRTAAAPIVVATSHGLESRAWTLAREEARLGREGPGVRTRVTYPLTGLWPARLGLRHADHVFCLSAEDRDHLLHDMQRAATSVTRIYPGADALYAREAMQRDYSRGERVLFAATWRKNKGVEDLVPSFLELARRHPHLRLVIVGAGVEESVVRAHFPSSLQTRLVCPSPGDERSMAQAFADADLFLLPSLFEGTPLTLMQAMMSGLPIVTTATCGMKDVIADGVNGLLVPIRSPQAIATAVTRLAGDRELRERLGRTAQRDAIASYTWDHVAAPVLAVYERLHRDRINKR